MHNKLPYESKEVKILVKREEKTNPSYGRNPNEISTEELLHTGVINVNKPKGPTSHQVSDYMKNILHLGKAGHSGTLDPKVTGVLTVALDKGTKMLQALLKAGKEYVAIMHTHKLVEKEKLIKKIKSFEGTISQIPPLKSAVVRKERKRTVYYIDIIEIDGQDVLMRVGCEAGTYIRKLIHDIGLQIGGAHMAELVRTKVGFYNDNNMFSMQDISDAFYYYKEKNNDKMLRKIINPIETSIEHLPKIWVDDAAVKSLCHGVALKIPGVSKLTDNVNKKELVALMTLKNELIALGVAEMNSQEIMKNDKGICARTDRVMMNPDVYPRLN